MTIAEEHRYPCQQCGADLRFSPGQTGLKCDHCGFEQTIAAEADADAGPWDKPTKTKGFEEHPLAKGLSNDLPATASTEVRVTKCTNCGASVEFSGAIHATECPFCAGPIVVDTGAERKIKPQAVIPFALDEKSAHNAMIAWLGSLWFAPNRLVEFARTGRAMNGVYVPYWTFDADTQSQYTGAKGVHYYVKNKKKTRWSPASGHVSRDFDDVLAIASTALPAHLGEGLEPWDLAQLQPYKPNYLAGFQAEGYTVALADGNVTAKQKMASVIEQDVRHDIGGDAQRVDNVATSYSAETFKHILLPIWIAAYKYKAKTYRFLVNGQTGEVQGERPYSVWKITFAALGAAILAAAAYYLIQKFEQGG